MSKHILMVLMLSLSGCAFLSDMIVKGAEVNDEALKASEFTICKAASVGAILRRYNTKELATAWLELCTGNQDGAPVMLEGFVNE